MSVAAKRLAHALFDLILELLDSNNRSSFSSITIIIMFIIIIGLDIIT